MSAFDSYVQAKFHGNVMAGGPTFTTVHDAETPLRRGYADSIAEFFRVGPKAGTSAHAMVDPGEAIKLLPDNVVAWAAGPYANSFGWHLEQAGYASFTRADWTTDDGMAQLQRAAACLREVHDTWGIPKRWCTDDQLRRASKGDRASGGMTTHQQVARVLGGTTHTDPEDNYPRDLLLQALLAPSTQAPTLQEDDEMYPYKGYRSDPKQHEDDGRTGDGTMVLAAPGVWDRVETPALGQLYVDAEMVKEYKNVRPDSFRALRDKWLKASPSQQIVDAVREVLRTGVGT